jgi:hypothetical protein
LSRAGDVWLEVNRVDEKFDVSQDTNLLVRRRSTPSGASAKVEVSEMHDCARNGMVSGCYPLDAFYTQRPERAAIAELKQKSASLSYSNIQPEPHWGRPQVCEADEVVGRLEPFVFGAALTLNNFSILLEPHAGHSGDSAPRTSTSDSRWHSLHWYS